MLLPTRAGGASVSTEVAVLVALVSTGMHLGVLCGVEIPLATGAVG